MKKILVALLAGAMLAGCVTLAACTATGEKNTEAPTDTPTQEEVTEPSTEAPSTALKLSDCTIYCPATANAWERKAAKALAASIHEKFGIEIAVNSDEAARTENEILVGHTALGDLYPTADDASIGCNGYEIAVKNNKIVLSAKMESGINSAIGYFTATAVTGIGADATVAEDYTYLQKEQISVTKPDENKYLNVTVPGDTGYDVYQVPAILGGGYRYGPSIMVYADGSMDAWFASSGSGGEQWDWITYKHSDDGVNWSEEKVVLQPTPGSYDHYSCCDPGVIYFNGYYYIGYTSTLNSNQCDNCIFVARSENPDGPYEKWNGEGWGGTHLEPIVYFDETYSQWGAGEPSFVELNGTLYIYYTWSGSDGRVSYVATADATDENWPATMKTQGIAIPSGSNDSIDVKYVEEYGKFLAIATDSRLSKNSYLVFFESNDGIHFQKVDVCKANVYFYCHNSGISGSENGHIVSGRKTMVGYAYGEGWGIWNTRFQEITIDLADKIDLSEQNGPNLTGDSVLDTRDPATLPVSGITTLGSAEYRFPDSTKAFLINTYSCTSYHNDWTMLGNNAALHYSGYDTSVIKCTNGSRKVTVVGVGKTVINIEWKGFVTSVFVEIYPADVNKDEVVAIEPLVKSEFTVDLTSDSSYTPQLRTIIHFADGRWQEAFGEMVTYSGYDESILRIDGLGRVKGLKSGTTEVTVTRDGVSCKMKVTIIGTGITYDYSHLEFESGDLATKIMNSMNNTEIKIVDGVLVCTPSPASDPFIQMDYASTGLSTDAFKSITLEYKIDGSNTAYMGQLFFCCGANSGPSETNARKYTLIADGEWHTVTITVDASVGWSGDINMIRFDYFDGCAEGDIFYLKSLTLDKK